MMHAKLQIERIAREFWATTQAEFRYDYDIVKAVESSGDVHLIRMQQLSPTKITSWLINHEIDIPFESTATHLNGALLIRNEKVIMFIDANENISQQRFTLAQQVSHFLLNYQMPKERAIMTLGKKIAHALRGNNDTSVTQLVQSTVSDIAGNAYTLLIEKKEETTPTDWEQLRAEDPAVSLTLELLAPRYQIINETASVSARLRYSPFKRKCQELLIDKYRIPSEIAHKYASELAGSVTSGPSFLSKLGIF